MARKKKHPEHVNHERWLVSYADFITLLFATFTMLFAISNVEKAKLAQAASSISKAFGGPTATITIPSIITPNVTAQGNGASGAPLSITIISPPAPQSSSRGKEGDDSSEDSSSGAMIKSDNQGPGKNEGMGAGSGGGTQTQNVNGTPTPSPTPQSTPATAGPDGGPQIGKSEGQGDTAMAAKLATLMETLGLKGKVEVRQEKRGTVISLGSTAFFNEGEVTVKPTSTYQLDKVVNALRDQNFEIRIEGHTDNTPIKSGRYSSNTELSALRATNIMDFMIKQYHYPPELLSAAGYGEYKPVADNATPEGREKNRRVDIVILNQRMKALEPQAAAQTAQK